MGYVPDFFGWARASLNGDVDTDAVIVPPHWIQAMRAMREVHRLFDIATYVQTEGPPEQFEAFAALANCQLVLRGHTKVTVPTSLVRDWADLVMERIVAECRENYTCLCDSWLTFDMGVLHGQSVGTIAAGPAKDVSMIGFGDVLRTVAGFVPPPLAMYVSCEYTKSSSFALHF